VYAARVAEAWRRSGHDVLLLCQQRDVRRLPFVDAWGTVGADGAVEPVPTGAPEGPGRVTMLRPDIGTLLPVFVWDEYEGFEAKPFVHLTDEELDHYLESNVVAMRRAIRWRRPDAMVAGHAMAGPVIARRAAGERTYAAKVHGSDLEYAARAQERYRALAREGLEGATRVTGASRDVLARAEEVAPEIRGRTRVVPPGVEVDRWRPLRRPRALAEAAGRLRADAEMGRGRPEATDRLVAEALEARDVLALDRLGATYDQSVPDPGAPDRLDRLAPHRGPLVGYLGKLIPEKGVERLLEALALLDPSVRGLVVGFGTFREWLTALVVALDRGDAAAHGWLGETSSMSLELSPKEVKQASGVGERLSFTGRLDHRYAPEAVAAMDVLVVPSTLDEAFGMVAAEGAAAGAFPLVARHSALAEVAEALERSAEAPGLLSFEPGPGAARRLAAGLDRLLALPPEEARRMRERVRAHVASQWTWERTAQRLLDAAAARDGLG
jgi:glycosyltransferase involved in cell wall biosynthesis